MKNIPKLTIDDLDKSPWFYQEKVFDKPKEEDVGFVYLIEELDTGKKYIGKKNFWKIIKLQPLKGKVNKRHIKRQSDWPFYFGSNKELLEKINSDNIFNYRRTILHLCESKGLMSYIEMKEQIERKVLFDKDYYNSFIGGKIHETHIKKQTQEL